MATGEGNETTETTTEAPAPETTTTTTEVETTTTTTEVETTTTTTVEPETTTTTTEAETTTTTTVTPDLNLTPNHAVQHEDDQIPGALSEDQAAAARDNTVSEPENSPVLGEEFKGEKNPDFAQDSAVENAKAEALQNHADATSSADTDQKAE